MSRWALCVAGYVICNLQSHGTIDQQITKRYQSGWHSDTSSPARSPIRNAQYSVLDSYWHAAGVGAVLLGRHAGAGARRPADLWRAGAGAARSGAAVCALDHATL